MGDSYWQGKSNFPSGTDTDEDAYRRGQNDRMAEERRASEQAAAEDARRSAAAEQARREEQQRQQWQWPGSQRSDEWTQPATQRPQTGTPLHAKEPDFWEWSLGTSLGIGLVVGAATYFSGGPWLRAGLLSAAATFVVIVTSPLLAVATLAAAALVVLHLAGVDVSPIVDPARELAQDAYQALRERLWP